MCLNKAFNEQLIAGMMKKEGMMDQYREVIIPKIFDNPIESMIVERINAFYDKYQRPPTFKEIGYIMGKSISDPNASEVCASYLKVIESAPIVNLSFIMDEVIEFGKVQAYKASMEEAARLIEIGGVSTKNLKDIFEKAIGFGNIKSKERELVFGLEAFEELLDHRKTIPAIPTGFNFIDETLHNEGLTPGNIMLILAASKVGKSAFLVELSVRAIMNGIDVLYYTLEIDRYDTVSRFITNMFGCKLYEIKYMPDEIKDQIKRFQDDVGSNLTILEYPSKTLSVDMVRRKIKRLDPKPQIVVIDYAMLMQPLDYKDPRFSIGGIPIHLRGMASEENVIIYTAWQTNRNAWDKELVESIDIGESSLPVMDSDLVVTLTPDENNNEERRYIRGKVDRSRIGVDGSVGVLKVSSSWKFMETEMGRKNDGKQKRRAT